MSGCLQPTLENEYVEPVQEMCRNIEETRPASPPSSTRRSALSPTTVKANRPDLGRDECRRQSISGRDLGRFLQVVERCLDAGIDRFTVVDVEIAVDRLEQRLDKVFVDLQFV